ncbi:MAG: hypothetical protein AABX59_01165 [Nanoarchaeota archaeon]
MNNKEKYEELCSQIDKVWEGRYVALWEDNGESKILAINPVKSRIEEIVEVFRDIGLEGIEIYQITSITNAVNR